MAAPNTPASNAAPELEQVLTPYAPTDAEKVSYVWRALPYLSGNIFLSAGCLIVALVLFDLKLYEVLPLMLPVFGLYTVVYIIYQVLSLPINFSGRGFDLDAHADLVRRWSPLEYPSVDIFLPICGEPIEVLTNTWDGVEELLRAYPGEARAYILDDGDSDEAAAQCPQGFIYLRRPEHKFKKSGNLNYGFTRSTGKHIVIFDADFRPRNDFLSETLPYLDNEKVGIVQTPQFFRVQNTQTWVERAAGPTLEVFYRAVQVSRNRFGSALCVGSNAVYRRAALEPTGGFTEIPYAEDSHTGLDARKNGFKLVYIPVPLATGICPSTLESYMRQQYRWCCGATSLVWSDRMWRVSMPFKSRLPYVAGWFWNLYTALRTLLNPLIPIVLLWALPNAIHLRNSLLLLPAVLNGLILYPLWHNSRYSVRIWPLSIAVGWAQALALWDFARGHVMSWEPSRGPADTKRRFWWGVTIWNGGLAVAWLALAIWRIEQTGSLRFLVVAAFGTMNLLVISRLIFSGTPRVPISFTNSKDGSLDSADL